MNNLNTKKEGGNFKINLNPQLYPLDVIYTAAYVFTDRAYISLEGDKDKEIIINIMPKENEDGEKLALEFNNELINYTEYKTNFENNKEIRNLILQRAIITNDPEHFEDDEKIDEVEEEDENLEELENTVIPWENENEN